MRWLRALLALAAFVGAACTSEPPPPEPRWSEPGTLYSLWADGGTARDSLLTLTGINQFEQSRSWDPDSPIETLSVEEFLALWPTISRDGTFFGATLVESADFPTGAWFPLDVTSPHYSAEDHTMTFVIRARGDEPPQEFGEVGLSFDFEPGEIPNGLGRPYPPTLGTPTVPCGDNLIPLRKFATWRYAVRGNPAARVKMLVYWLAEDESSFITNQGMLTGDSHTKWRFTKWRCTSAGLERQVPPSCRNSGETSGPPAYELVIPARLDEAEPVTATGKDPSGEGTWTITSTIIDTGPVRTPARTFESTKIRRVPTCAPGSPDEPQWQDLGPEYSWYSPGVGLVKQTNGVWGDLVLTSYSP